MNRAKTLRQVLGLAGLLVFTQATSAEMAARHQRFVQRDPLGTVDGPNVYALGRGKPLHNIDPTGQMTMAECCCCNVAPNSSEFGCGPKQNVPDREGGGTRMCPPGSGKVFVSCTYKRY